MSGYIEDESLTLEPSENGVITIGDLYNCNESASVGYNLFGPLTGEHIAAYPIQDSQYSFCRVKTLLDKIFFLSLDVEFEIPIIPSLLSIGGGVGFKFRDGNRLGDEEVLCICRKDYFSVRILKEIYKNIDRSIREKIKSGSIRATHVVTEVITGARLTANITIHEEGPRKRFYLKGKATGTLDVVVASASLGASLWIDDESEGLDITTDITVDSRPPVKSQPKNMRELLKMINVFNADDEKPFKMIKDNNVTGVPVKFLAVPIQQFLSEGGESFPMPMEKFYKIIDKDLLQSLLVMITTLRDIQEYQYLKIRVLEKDFRLEGILKDSENELTMKISENENQLKISSVEYQTKFFRAMFDYKLGLKDTTALRELLKDFEQQFEFCKIHAEVLNYAAEGRQQLLGVQAMDYIEEENDIEFFSNLQDLQDWLESSTNLKIILQAPTSETSFKSYGAILTLFELSKPLKEIGIETGIVYPNISKEFSITFTSHGTSLDTGKKFIGTDVIFALHILRVAIGQGYPVESRFYSCNASLNSINLPLKSENLTDITSLISTSVNFQNVKMCESFLKMREVISKDDKWKFVLNVDIPDNFVEGLTCFKRLKTFLEERFPQLEYDLIVGTFGSHIVQQKFTEAPVLLIFRKNKLAAVCLDNLDLQMMLQKFVKVRHNEDPDLSTFSLKNFTEICLFPERCRFSVAIANLWGDREFYMKNFSRGSLEMSTKSVIPITIELIRAAVSGDNNQIIASGAKICLTYSSKEIFPELLNILKQNKWDEGKEAFLVDVSTRAIDFWRGLHGNLNNYYYTNDTFLSKLDLAVRALEEYTSDKDTYDSIQAIIDDPECPLDLRVKLEKCLAADADERLKQTALIEAMDPYIEKMKARVNYTNIHGEETTDVIAKYDLVLRKLEESSKEMKRRLNSESANPQSIIDDIILYSGPEGEKLKERVDYYTGNFEVYVKGAHKVFDAYKGEITSAPRYQHLKALIDFADHLGEEEPVTTPAFLADIITRYILALNEDLYPGTWPKAVSFTKRQSFYQTLDILRKSIANPALRTVFDNLDTLYETPNEDLLIQIVTNLGDFKLTANNYRDLWENPKFYDLMKYGIRFPNFLNSIKQFQCHSDYDVNFVPAFIPPDFAQEIKALVVASSITFEWKRAWDDLQDFLQVLQIILIRGRLPKDFQRVLWNNIQNNQSLKEKLLEVDVLYFWNETGGYFDEAWDFSTVNRAVTAIKEWILKDKDNVATIVEIELNLRDEEFKDESSAVDSKIYLNPKWDKLTGGSLERQDNSALYQFIDTLTKPKVSEDEMTTFMSQVISYVFQQLQLLDSTALTPKHISECVEKLRDQFETERPGNIKLDSDDEDEENPPVSRLDVLTCMLNTTETDLSIWLLQTLARFPSPLPLIVPNITFNPTKSFKLLLPWLKHLISTAKSSFTLFTDPYRLILCVRIGDSESETVGKSQILNSFLKPANLFSSKNEPGSNTGKPLSLPGFVEFVELSQDTCAENVWEELNSKNPLGYPILLANVHGDILEYPETLSMLSQIASSFLVFHNRDSWTVTKDKTKQLKELIKYPKSRNTLHVFVDPIGEVFLKIKPTDLIESKDFSENLDLVIETITNLLVTGLSFDPVTKIEDIDNDYESIDIVEKMETSLSQNIIDHCTSNSCKLVKDAFKLNEKAPNLSINDFNRIWLDNSDLREYISLFVSITKLPPNRRRIAFSHLSQRLAQLAFGETQVLRKISDALIPHLEKELDAEGVNYSKERVINLQRYIKEIHYRQQHDRLITPQDFFNELIAIYELPSHSPSNEKIISWWPQSSADYFDSGFPIELSCHKNSKWTDNFLLHLKELYDDLRIFVVSIIGPENSGKSRLLNDLFGTKFMTRPRNRSKGISVSLVHLKETSRQQLQNDVDALVVIDTEGLCPLETVGNNAAETEQREMIGQVIALSHLVIFNATGNKRGTVDYMQNILELPLMTLSRLGNGGFLGSTISLDVTVMKKDVLLVHHSVENENASLETNFRELSMAFEMAANYSYSNAVKIGHNHNLEEIFPSIIGKDVDQEFISCKLRPYKNDWLQGIPYFDDVNNIKQKIVSIVKRAVSSPTANIVDWFHSAQIVQDWFTNQNYPNSNFPCNLNSVQELKTYSETREGLLNKFKAAVDTAIEYHIDNMIEEINTILKDKSSKEEDLNFLIDKSEYILSSCDLEAKTSQADRSDKESALKFPCSFCKDAVLLSSNVEIQNKTIDAPSGVDQSVKLYMQRKCDYFRQYSCQKIMAAKFKYGMPSDIKELVAAKMKLMMSDPHEYGDKPVVLDECFYYLQQLVVTEGVQLISLIRMLVADAQEEYKHSFHLVNSPIWKSLTARENLALDAKFYFEKQKITMNWEKDQWLHNQLQRMLPVIFKDSGNIDIFRIGMIRSLKENIDDSIEQFQIRHKSQLSSEEKWKVHSSGLTVFYQQALSSPQFGLNFWNESSENNPLSYLSKFKQQILEELDQLFKDINLGFYP